MLVKHPPLSSMAAASFSASMSIEYTIDIQLTELGFPNVVQPQDSSGRQTSSSNRPQKSSSSAHKRSLRVQQSSKEAGAAKETSNTEKIGCNSTDPTVTNDPGEDADDDEDDSDDSAVSDVCEEEEVDDYEDEEELNPGMFRFTSSIAEELVEKNTLCHNYREVLTKQHLFLFSVSLNVAPKTSNTKQTDTLGHIMSAGTTL